MISEYFLSLRKKLSKEVGEPNKQRLKQSAILRRRYISNLIHRGKIDKSSFKYHAIFLTFFGCGKWRYGPGTLTSFITTIIWLGVSYYFYLQNVDIVVETTMWISLAVTMFIYGIFIIPIYSTKLDREDHPSIVLDEVMGQIVALSLSYPFLKPYYFAIEDIRIKSIIIISHVSVSFMLFRILDITKPSIIGRIDRNIKGGAGVMLDDLVCGLLASGFTILLFFICYYAINIDIPQAD